MRRPFVQVRTTFVRTSTIKVIVIDDFRQYGNRVSRGRHIIFYSACTKKTKYNVKRQKAIDFLSLPQIFITFAHIFFKKA